MKVHRLQNKWGGSHKKVESTNESCPPWVCDYEERIMRLINTRDVIREPPLFHSDDRNNLKWGPPGIYKAKRKSPIKMKGREETGLRDAPLMRRRQEWGRVKGGCRLPSVDLNPKERTAQ